MALIYLEAHIGDVPKDHRNTVMVKERGFENKRVVVQKEPEKGHEHLKWVNLITSNLKRYLLSTHHGVFPKYRKAFLAEFAY